MKPEASIPQDDLKSAVRAHWESEPCGTRQVEGEDRRAYFNRLEEGRYAAEPCIEAFADWSSWRGARVLEIGVGAGTDFIRWSRAGARATGVDLTDAGVVLARERLALEGLRAEVRRADAEALPFETGTFDLVYSWGVLHHTPDTETAIREVRRVLRPGGTTRIMVYQHPSLSGLMLWGIHGLARGRPGRSPRRIVYDHMESPGTKSYKRREAHLMFGRCGFEAIRVRADLLAGDLLLMPPSERVPASLYRIVSRLWPRWALRRWARWAGHALLIEARKPASGPWDS